MLTTEPSTLQLKFRHLRHVLGYLSKSPLDFICGKDVAIEGHSDIDKTRKFIEQIQLVHQRFKNNMRKSKESTKQGMTSIIKITSSKLVMKFGFTLTNRGSKEKVKS